MGGESPRLELCQALADSFRLQNGEIAILVKNGRVVRVLPKVAVNANEPDVMEAVQLGPAPPDPSPREAGGV